eukprot:scaffold69118_cov37-Phaeocystis_antarctica.AAC.2
MSSAAIGPVHAGGASRRHSVRVCGALLASGACAVSRVRCAAVRCAEASYSQGGGAHQSRQGLPSIPTWPERAACPRRRASHGPAQCQAGAWWWEA